MATISLNFFQLCRRMGEQKENWNNKHQTNRNEGEKRSRTRKWQNCRRQWPDGHPEYDRGHRNTRASPNGGRLRPISGYKIFDPLSLIKCHSNIIQSNCWIYLQEL